MRLGEKLLLYLSKDPNGSDYDGTGEERNIDEVFSILCGLFPNFKERICGKEVIDFGCGSGRQSVAMAKNGAKRVLGIDSNLKSLDAASNYATGCGVADNVAFIEKLDERHKRNFDVVLSHNSMEHFDRPYRMLDEMASVLKENGELLITFGPPWYAPYGSHMHFFTRVPWVNILFSEKTVMAVRSHFRNDGAKAYAEVESGLNKMTVSRFEKIIRRSSLDTVYKRYDCVKGVDILRSMPVVRELFINHITYILKRIQ